LKRHSTRLKTHLRTLARLGIFIAALTFVLAACSPKKNTFFSRAYNNLTAHYNAWWNGNESLKEGITDLERSSKDNFTQLLPVFKLGSKKELSAITSKADRAIEKASIVIQRHSMVFNKKEHNKWIDDSYLMIGKAYFYKQDYNGARRTFEFIQNKFKDSPLIDETTLWLALTNVQTAQYAKAETELGKFKAAMAKTPKPRRLNLFYNKIYAEFFLKQDKGDFARPYLLTGLQLASKKTDKTRLLYILAQLYQKDGNLAKATEYYKQVVKKNPRYDMVFSALINIAKCFDASSGDSRSIVKTLERMLDDVKNKEYKDQIYYALSEVYLKQDSLKRGIENLRLSVANSKGNDFQRSHSALTLADIYFQMPDYQSSQAYYDTALQALPRESPNYDALQTKTKILTELVQNLVIIQTEDSLQKLATMPEAERNKIIDKIIAKLAEEEQKKREMEAARQSDINSVNQLRNDNIGGTNKGGGWYFYNPSAVSFGFTEFTKKWGSRKLEDLWRLSNKQMIEFEEVADGEVLPGDSIAGDSTLARRSTDPMKRETYIQNLPLTPKAIDESNVKIKEALFNAAFVYREGLKDFPNAAESFESLVERFPDTAQNPNLLISCYQLVTIHQKLENPDKVEFYKNLILKNYPDTDYAKILTDPDYNQEIERKKNMVSAFYEQSYDAYKSGQYYLALMNCDDARKKYSADPLMPKFDFLRALAIAKVDIVDSMVTNLKYVIKKHPNSEVTPRAKKILELLAKSNPDMAQKLDFKNLAVVEPKAADTLKTIYISNLADKHYFILKVNSNEVDVNALKIRLSDFNSKEHSLDNYTISSIMFDATDQLVSVGIMASSEKAMEYYNQIIDNQYIMAGITEKQYAIFVISATNYPLLYQNKDLDKYMLFFNKEYLTGSK
jgi:tetratricopeptide (TPR) repeat protein